MIRVLFMFFWLKMGCFLTCTISCCGVVCSMTRVSLWCRYISIWVTTLVLEILMVMESVIWL